jgi:hypothetical protein
MSGTNQGEGNVNQSSKNWSLRILAAYSQRWDGRTVQEFRDGATTLLADVERHVRAEQPSVHLEPLFLAPGRRDSSHAAVAASVAFAILDVTDEDEDLAFLVGLVQGARVPHVLVHRGASAEICTLDADGIHYRSHSDLFVANPLLKGHILQAITQARILEELIYEVWFPRDTSTIWIVCPQIHEPGEFANRSNPDYTYLDNLGDTDALLEVMVFLSRYYPKAIIEKFTSQDLPRGHANNNLVVIGGPGSSDSISNEVCQEMMRSVSSHVAYSEDCEKMLVTSGTGQVAEFHADLRTDASDSHQPDRFNLARDHGYFARFPNPLNESATVVLVNGIHTAGVLGAARAFSDRRESLPNHHLLFNSHVNAKSFECHFEVGVVHGNVRSPAVRPENVHSLGMIATLPISPTSDAIRPQSNDNRRRSVTIVFIAGDRGGGQRNQIQIPREFDSIQNALRGCKYRDAISLAAPTLAATYQKLVEAYRHRPAILHFAGHGDDRSLSFISDQDVLVSETPLVQGRLSAILRSFPDRIRLCVLNTCDSEAVAKYLVDNHAVESAIGWPGKLADADAISFSGMFYECLGDGLTLSRSIALATQTLASNNAPSLYTDDGIDRDVIYVG